MPMGPAHPPAGGHQLGFNDLKTVEAHELLNRIAGKPSLTIDFDEGLAAERVDPGDRAVASGSAVAKPKMGGLGSKLNQQ